MSKYTTEIRFICESVAGKYESGGLLTLDEVLTLAIPKIFDFDFPIFDESYRNVLERKILRHYYTREIAFETYALFKMFLETRLNEIMPYYNKLYETTVFNFNPNYEVDYYRIGESKDDNSIANTGTVTSETADERTIASTNASTGETNFASFSDTTTSIDYTSDTDYTSDVDKTSEYSGTDTNTTKVKMSDTPQGGVQGLDSDTYLTQYTKTEANGTNSSDQTDNSKTVDKTEKEDKTEREDATNRSDKTETENNSTTNTTDELTGRNTRTDNTLSTIKNNRDYEEHVFGVRSGSSYMETITKFRENILNIDMLIINELNDLFFGLW